VNGQALYIPVLKWRQGEYRALKDLAEDVKLSTLPLIEIPPVAWDFVEERPQKPLRDHLAPMPNQILEHWGGDCFVDFRLLASESLPTEELNEAQPVDIAKELRAFFEALGARASSVVPVTTVSRDAAFQDAVRQIAESYGTGACIRLGLESALEPRAVSNLASILRLTPGLTDVIVDLQKVDPNQLALLRLVLKNVLGTLSNQGYRSLALIGSAFPMDLSEVTPGVGSIPRSEWALWTQLKQDLDASVLFGDYGIANVEVREIDPRLMVASASIRYTAISEWMIFRGRSLREIRYGGYNQFRTLSIQVVDHSSYSGPKFSWGDDYLFKCAYSLVGTGNLTTWRQVGTNHHITFVVRQLASARET